MNSNSLNTENNNNSIQLFSKISIFKLKEN